VGSTGICRLGNSHLPPQSPVAAKKEKKVSCMFIPDGRVSVSAQIDRKGFCEGESLRCALGGGERGAGWWDGQCPRIGGQNGHPAADLPSRQARFPPAGDDICINADFENTCSRIVVPKAAIVAKHTYLANGQTKVFTQKLSCVRGNHIISGMSESWRGKTIRVKKLKPSILGCNILRVEYFLQVSGAAGCGVGGLCVPTGFRTSLQTRLLPLADLRQRPGLQEDHPGAAPGHRQPLGHREPQLQHGQSDQLRDELGGSEPPRRSRR